MATGTAQAGDLGQHGHGRAASAARPLQGGQAQGFVVGGLQGSQDHGEVHIAARGQFVEHLALAAPQGEGPQQALPGPAGGGIPVAFDGSGDGAAETAQAAQQAGVRVVS